MKFKSKKLQQTFKAASPVLEQTENIKNETSDQLKNFENYLKSLAISDEHAYQIKDPSDISSYFEVESVEESEINYCGLSEGVDLVWDLDKKRLMYKINQYEAEMTEPCDPDWGYYQHVQFDKSTCKTIMYRPLIETPYEVRKVVLEEHLGPFIKSMAEKYKDNSKAETKVPDPF